MGEAVKGKVMVPGWVHQPGSHCGSTALSDLMNFSGHPCSEPLCFGLGAGLGFYYVEIDQMSPSRMFHVRSSGLEPEFFDSLAIPFAWERTEDVEEASQSARTAVARGQPVLLRTDIFYLDYYRSSTHFNGHVVILWGYDDAREEFYLSDTSWAGLQAVSYTSLAKARVSKAPPVTLSNDHFIASRLSPGRSLAEAIPIALRKNAQQMLSSTAGNPSFAYGIEGLGMLRERLPQWAEAPDWKWCTRFTYQVIEKRGTGGAGFRLLYQRFLQEAEDILPSLRPHSLPGKMEGIAALWSRLAAVLKGISETDSPRDLGKAGILAGQICSEEEAFYRQILSIL